MNELTTEEKLKRITFYNNFLIPIIDIGGILNKMRDDICYEYAFCLVSESFIHLGGKMHQDELVYKGTKKWEEAKFITNLTIEKMSFNPLTSELIENNGFWKSVQEEINNL